MQKRVYAIIVTFNAMHWAERCFSSLRASSVPPTTIVVDNGSTDETVHFIRKNYPEVIVLEQTTNLGFGQGNNAGIRYALEHGASHVLLLNQDAWIDATMIERLLPYSDGNSLISPIHMTGEGDRMDRNFHKNAFMRSKEIERMEHDIQAGKTDRYYTDEINAACWFLPKAILKEVGGFNPMFFHYAEDNDYLQRLHYYHKGIYIVPGTYVYHDRANVPEKIPTAQSIYQQLILRAVDINYTPFVCALHIMRYGLAVWHTAFAEHRLRDIALYYQAKHRFSKQTKAILENRQIIQTKGAHWLE